MHQANWIKWQDWPMLALSIILYPVILGLCWLATVWPVWLVAPAGAYMICLFGGLQHEALHGHPTRSKRLNELLVFLPFTLWLPYRRFRSLHLKHHRNDHLTEPGDDPESFYLAPHRWHRLPLPVALVLSVNNTLVGRLCLGPLIAVIQILRHDWRAVVQGDIHVIKAWLLHALGVGLVWLIITRFIGLPFGSYMAGFVYPALSLTMLRSFAEHRAHETAACRSVIIESGRFFSLLYLNNNLHAVHHAHPDCAWHQLPALYQRQKQRFRAQNCYYVIQGYRQLLQRYSLRTKEPVPHPLHR